MDKDLPASRRFILTAVNIGGSLEWYEIGLFIAWPLIIQQNVTNFETTIAEVINTSAIILMVLMALASGGARAIGGWFFGKKGDQKGRKIAFPLTIALATLPSWGIVIASFFLSYEQWISYSTIIFTIIKFFQGMPAGGEIPGAICYLAEAGNLQGKTATLANRRYMCSYAMLGPQIGLALSAFVCLILKFFFSVDFLLSHAWRYVFIVSGVMGFVGFMMRKKLHETATFLDLKTHHKITCTPLKTLFTKYSSRVLFGSLISIFEIVSFSVLSIIPLYYSKNPFNFAQDKIIFMNLGSAALCIIFIPLIGYLSSKYTKFPWLKVSAWGVVLLSFVLYKTLIGGAFLSSLIINVIMIFLFSIQASILPSILAEIFPAQVRYTGLAFSFNICDGILWSIVTSVSFWFMLNSNPSFVLFLPLSAGIFLITSWVFNKHRNFEKFLI